MREGCFAQQRPPWSAVPEASRLLNKLYVLSKITAAFTAFIAFTKLIERFFWSRFDLFFSRQLQCWSHVIHREQIRQAAIIPSFSLVPNFLLDIKIM